MKKKACIFILADKAHSAEFEAFKKSLRHFHTEEEVDLLRYTGEEEIKTDPKFFVRSKPIIASKLINEYEVVIAMDCDELVLGDISFLWADTDADALCVFNGNPKETKAYPVAVWDIRPEEYVNCGLVVMRSPRFINHWAKLDSSPRLDHYQMADQDMLNIIVHYGDYKTLVLDTGDSFWGLSSKGYWPFIELRGDELVLPKGKDGYPDVDKKIKVIHVAGGRESNKMDIGRYFSDEVWEHIEKIIK